LEEIALVSMCVTTKKQQLKKIQREVVGKDAEICLLEEKLKVLLSHDLGSFPKFNYPERAPRGGVNEVLIIALL
jgi:hypothetical protein